MISFQAFQLPAIIFRSLKMRALRLTVQHDKSLRSSHFSTKTIQRSVDSALPPLPTLVAAAASSLFLRSEHFIDCWRQGPEARVLQFHEQMHTEQHYITTVRALDLSAWVTQSCRCQGFTSSFLISQLWHGCGNGHHPAGVSWNGGDHDLEVWPHFGSD